MGACVYPPTPQHEQNMSQGQFFLAEFSRYKFSIFIL